jgi:hypothetical protein
LDPTHPAGQLSSSCANLLSEPPCCTSFCVSTKPRPTFANARFKSHTRPDTPRRVHPCRIHRTTGMRLSVRSVSRSSMYHIYLVDSLPRPTLAPWAGSLFGPSCTDNPPSAANRALHLCCLLLLPLNQVCISDAHHQSIPVLTPQARNRSTPCPISQAWAMA